MLGMEEVPLLEDYTGQNIPINETVSTCQSYSMAHCSPSAVPPYFWQECNNRLSEISKLFFTSLRGNQNSVSRLIRINQDEHHSRGLKVNMTWWVQHSHLEFPREIIFLGFFLRRHTNFARVMLTWHIHYPAQWRTPMRRYRFH